ncbi:hypothetical protein B0H63DRAFT_218029 [Podospora didyma]|uniref:Uncharacterized protein n=1 Tax=Podospora didyma TaxID=330526 RepID=A0AAE0TWE7_9PEZI|nr:hypothetical protein B0H63DRAFT_218029 [Podospora didyma]
MPSAEQTENGDYEYVYFFAFAVVDYDRYMSWKSAENGCVFLIVNGTISGRSNKEDEANVLLPSGHGVLVVRATFKLQAKP